MELFRALGALCEPPSPLHRPAAEALGLPGEPRGRRLRRALPLPALPVRVRVPRRRGQARRRRARPCRRLLARARARAAGRARPPRGAARALRDARRARARRARRGSPAAPCARRAARCCTSTCSRGPSPYLDRVDELAPPYYRAWARAAARGARRRGRASSAPRPRCRPRCARRRRSSAPSEVGGTAFLEQLLAPVRTGFILVRSDLVAAARELGLGLRIAERRYVLEALLGQDAAATLRWLSDSLRDGRAGTRRRSGQGGRGRAALLAEAAAHAEVQDVPAWSAPATAH